MREPFGNKACFEALDVTIDIRLHFDNPFDAHMEMSLREFNKLPCLSFGESGHLGIHGLVPLNCMWTMKIYFDGSGLFYKAL